MAYEATGTVPTQGLRPAAVILLAVAIGVAYVVVWVWSAEGVPTGYAAVATVVTFLAYALMVTVLVSRSANTPYWAGWALLALYSASNEMAAGKANFHTVVLVALAALVGRHAWRLRERTRAQELDATRVASRLVEAENRALRMQLQPHFLFNTLHSIATLIQHDPRAADAMITRLADLLRLTLELGSEQEIPLGDELRFVERYLAIEQVRFRDRLDVRIRVEGDCRSAMVPAFILQPVVENAVKHGFADEPVSCSIEVSAHRLGTELCLTVSDDGKGYQSERPMGTGLRVTLERLQLLYGAQHGFSVSGGPGSGTQVRIRVPWHEEHQWSESPRVLMPERMGFLKWRRAGATTIGAGSGGDRR